MRTRAEDPGESRRLAYFGACCATTPMLAIVSPFVIDGIARMNVTTPAEGK